MKQVQVDQTNIAQAEVVECAPRALPDGGVRIAVESFSVTANNITYAVMGDSFGYWNFFPAPEGFGIVPMWGHATAIESKHPDIAAGERVYGYLPMATHLDVFPGKVSKGSFTDTAEHRQPMSPVYNQYSRLAADPEHDPAREAERMIFGPLFKTGFLIEYFLRSEDWFGAKQLVVTSASSKTAMGLASVARHASPGIRRIGLTSSGNVAFVESTGLYDAVYAYENVGELPRNRSVSVDFAGNTSVLGEIHAHLGSDLEYSSMVGATHFEARDGDAADLAGPQPVLFFAPDHAVKLFSELGGEGAAVILAENWRRFLDDVDDTIRIERRSGIDAACSAYRDMVRGDIDPSTGTIIEF